MPIGKCELVRHRLEGFDANGGPSVASQNGNPPGLSRHGVLRHVWSTAPNLRKPFRKCALVSLLAKAAAL